MAHSWRRNAATLALLLVAITVLAEARRRSGGGGGEAGDFDFYYFVTQWPASFCEGQESCCGNPGSNFTIHGLWPNNDDGSYPSNCAGEEFDPSEVADLRVDLEREWPSFKCPANDDSFWEHEWQKHGTCSGLAEHDYFSAALQLLQSFDAASALEKAGISPDGTTQYALADVQKALSSATAADVAVQCNSENAVLQLYFCVAKSDTTHFTDCPTSPDSGCSSDSVLFPSLT